ncbi:hypothetical protein FB451DRAFT_1040073 [Mycena latifolia]|nr:hypothetical protein FB451DRAFT_1040073 [Mycena latifolia]
MAPPQSQNGANPNSGRGVIQVVHTDDAATKLSDRVRRRCFNCCTTDTSTWRRSNLSPGKVLCNKCGLFERIHSRPRPEQFPHKRGPLASSTLRSRSPPPDQGQVCILFVSFRFFDSFCPFVSLSFLSIPPPSRRLSSTLRVLLPFISATGVVSFPSRVPPSPVARLAYFHFRPPLPLHILGIPSVSASSFTNQRGGCRILTLHTSSPRSPFALASSRPRSVLFFLLRTVL